ncbi:hypothetical protein WR52_04940 [Bacillus cereus]|uniref:hypothetical protein n=1 Tax=Bacillus cereus TaxID=1396 RepID=UPI0007B6F830|nr:hypothetical protein [Bacillus cereus]MRC29981.1 hypothetical protein [Bacillus thuringiensis]ANC18117.1 hypothetical protein WR52_04940 [Bacillus cereus]MDA2478125.1 hypothetical protein [Bacillus cereus]MDA2495286.1 hypothetical protein [Bacillus cereus]HDR8043563.1 hypothetical protein [Bacillus cereus]
MNKKKIFAALIGIVALFVIINVVVTKEKTTSTSEKMYSEKEYNKLVDEHFEETQKLKSDMSVLETEKKSLDEQVKKLKDELVKKEQQVAQQPEKKEEPKPEQPTGAFENPMKSINKTEAMNKVKEKAKKDFQDDYMTQNFVAEEQSKVFDFLNSIEIKSQEELNVMKNALKDFSNDFMTAKLNDLIEN